MTVNRLLLSFVYFRFVYVKCNLYADRHGETKNMCIVEAYKNEKEAELGHARWIKVMATTPLPKTLTDCANSEIAQLIWEPIIFTLVKKVL